MCILDTQDTPTELRHYIQTHADLKLRHTHIEHEDLRHTHAQT